jgi:hypothetical protein
VGDGLGGGEFGELVVTSDRQRRGSSCATDGQLVVGERAAVKGSAGGGGLVLIEF